MLNSTDRSVTKEISFRLTEESFQLLKSNLLSDRDDKERFCFLYCNIAENDHEIVVYPDRLISFDDRDYQQQHDMFVQVPSKLKNSVYLDFATSESAYLISCHSHPFSRGCVSFSNTDDNNDRKQANWFNKEIPKYRKSVSHRYPNPLFLHLLIGPNSMCLRYLVGNRFFDVGKIVIVGKTVDIITPHTKKIEDYQNRTVLAFGEAGINKISKLSVAIVGLGGLGSIVAEGIARLGVKKILLVDNDIVEVTNLNRLQGATNKDIGRKKVEVIAERLREYFSDIEVICVPLDAVDQVAQYLLKCVDVIFGCVDNHKTRYYLNKLACTYLVSYFDGATRIIKQKDKNTAVPVRLGVIIPGLTNCMDCSIIEYYDKSVIFRGLSSQEVKLRLKSGGYIKDHPSVVSPSVYPQNLTLAGFILAEFINYASHYKSLYSNVYADYSSFDLSTKKKMAILDCKKDRTSDDGCLICDHYLGTGDYYQNTGR